jgi:hypothetical protein
MTRSSTSWVIQMNGTAAGWRHRDPACTRCRLLIQINGTACEQHKLASLKIAVQMNRTAHVCGNPKPACAKLVTQMNGTAPVGDIMSR